MISSARPSALKPSPVAGERKPIRLSRSSPTNDHPPESGLPRQQNLPPSGFCRSSISIAPERWRGALNPGSQHCVRRCRKENLRGVCARGVMIGENIVAGPELFHVVVLHFQQNRTRAVTRPKEKIMSSIMTGVAALTEAFSDVSASGIGITHFAVGRISSDEAPHE